MNMSSTATRKSNKSRQNESTTLLGVGAEVQVNEACHSWNGHVVGHNYVVETASGDRVTVESSKVEPAPEDHGC